MTRGVIFLTALLATLAVALPASAADGRSLKGTLVLVTSRAVAVKDSKNIVTRCAVVDRSPSLGGYATGDLVQAACVRFGKRLVLAKIRRLPASSGPPSNDAELTRFGGVVSALSDGSITVHDGDHDLTCSLGASSPSTAGVKVGQHVKVSCAGGALVGIAPVTTGDAGRAYEGTVTAVSATSLTVHTANGEGTCTVSDGSPSVADVKVGDRVLAGCKAGSNQLVLLKKLATPPPTVAPQPATTVAGTLTALSSASVTVHGEHGDVSCTVPATARLGDFHVGDRVGMACVDGALLKLIKL